MARPEQQVAAELRNLGCEVPPNYVSALAQALLPNDRVIDAIYGLGYARYEMIVQTAKQVLSVGQQNYGGDWLTDYRVSVSGVYWQDIARVDFDFNDGCRITVRGYGNAGYAGASFKKGRVDKLKAENFTQNLQNRIAATKSSGAPAPSSGTEKGLVQQLESLANLRERGHISKEEFEQAKKKLLQG